MLDRFCDYAEGGSSVTFRNANRTTKSATKEAVTFSTTDREAMKRWMAQMEDEGKTVTVTYDPFTGTWTGTAYANAPQSQGDLLTYESDQMNDFGYIWSFDTANRRVYITLHNTIQNITAPDYPAGAYEYRHADEVNTPFAYWLIDNWGDTAGLYLLESIGSDTLHFNSTHIGNPVNLVRTDRWQTYLCNKGVDIVMHVTRAGVEIYPQRYIGQMDVNGMGRIDLIWPFEFGRFLMVLTGLDADHHWLALDYRDFGGSEILGGFTIQSEPIEDNHFTISFDGDSFTFHRL